MTVDKYFCNGCKQDLRLDFGTGTPWQIAGEPGDFHDKNLGVKQDDEDADDPDLCGPIRKRSVPECIG